MFGKRTRKLEKWLLLSICGWVLTFGLVMLSSLMSKTQAQQSSVSTTMRVSELVVVDSKGVERVRIGGDLPDAFISGKRIPRGQQAARVLLYDASRGKKKTISYAG